MAGTIGIAILCAEFSGCIGILYVWQAAGKIIVKTIRLVVKSCKSNTINPQAIILKMWAKRLLCFYCNIGNRIDFSLVTGLPIKYFIINSMKPQNIVRTETFESKDIKTILITTQHSNISIIP